MSRIKVAVFQEAKKGNTECGDSYYYIETENGFLCALADGLGSGEFAKESSAIVIDIIKENIHASVESLIVKCNEELVGKRGAVLALLKINYQTETYSISSIGNVGVMTVTGENKKKRNIPNAGYLSGHHKKFRTTQEPLEETMNFIIYTDGVTNKDLSENYLFEKDVDRIVKSYAFKSEGKRTDDTTLIAVRYEKN